MSLIEIRNLTFAYPGSFDNVFEGLNLRLDTSWRLGLVGRNGRGKTTLCRLLAGYDRPDAGEVLLDGRPLSTYRGYCPVQMVWQHPELVVDPLRTLGATLAVPGGASLTAFERLCDNALTAYLSQGKRVAFGEHPLIGYLYAKENELTTIRIILTGRLAGLDAETIRERLRESYV